jgi:DNA topoisomerase-1
MTDTEPLSQQEAATAANLHYVTDEQPGLWRRRCGKGFAYYNHQGELLRDESVKQRIRQLAIPPAYEEVWICPDPQGHLQATGINAAGKKQYLYHTRWREVRDEAKYTQMIAFGECLPGIRRAVKQHLQLPGLPFKKIMAAVVRLLDITHIRIGNQAYAQQNGSYGLTTLRKKHVETDDDHVTFEFTGKAGKD